MLIKAEYIDRFKIIKSQMAFDFSAPKHEEERTVRATTRHLASGAVAQVQAHQRRTEVTTPTGAQTIEARKINARDRFEQSLQTIAGISPEQATRVADYYVKHKLVKTDANVGQMNPVHGAYLDKDVILNAVKETEPVHEKNMYEHNGKPFWSGAFDPIDGHILETHGYEEAVDSDFHHSNYFSPSTVAKMSRGKAQFFWVDKGGINTEWRESGASKEIEKNIMAQITIRSATGKLPIAVKETEPAAQSSHPTREDLDRMKVKGCRSIENTPAFTRYKFDDNRSAVVAQHKIGGIRMDNTLVIAVDPDAKAEIPAVHAQDNRIYTTPEATQQNVAALLNEFLAPLNITFSYGKSSELQGTQGQAHILDGSRRLLTRKDATIDTLAHEIAHFVQYDQKGYTHCGSLKSSQGPGEGEHMRLTREYTAKLRQNKLGYLFMKANGMSWRTMAQDLEGAIGFQAPIMEVPKRKLRTKPEPKPAPEHRIAKVDDPDGGHGHFVVYDKDMKTVEIPNEQGEIEAAWPRLLDASRALNRHTGNTHTQTKVARGEYDMHKAIAHHPLLKSRKLHGSINFNGLEISIETGRSRCREWHNPHDGSQGMSLMKIPYGYIKRSLGVDGDHYDAFVGPDHSAPNVYIVTTMKAPDFTEIDEEKAFLGVNSAEEAERYYKASYSDDRFFGGVTTMPFEEFKEKVLATKDEPVLLGGEHKLFTEDEVRARARLEVARRSNNNIKKSGEAMCKQVGDKLSVNWKEIDLDEFCDGMLHEEEHKDVTGGSAEKTAKIVLAHLKENPKYYSKLEQAGL